jgi:predicted porin
MDMRKSLFPALALAAAVSAGFSSTLSASDVDYTYGELRYIFDADIDGEDGDGFRFGGSFRLTQDIYLFGSYDDTEFDDSDADVTMLKLGAGYIYPIDPTWDANFALAFARGEAETPRGDDDDSGIELTAGVRGKFKPEIEVRAELNYTTVEVDDDSYAYITLGGDYYFTPNISAGLELDLGGDYETMSIGARYHFK